MNYNEWIKSLQESYKDDGRNYTLKQLKRLFPANCEDWKETKNYD